MKTIELKTNIMCGSCVAKVTPLLNEAAGTGNWKVDVSNPKKVLSVITDKSENDILIAVEKAGFKAESL